MDSEGKHPMRAHKDFWDRMRQGIDARGREQFEMGKVKGNATQQEVGDDKDLVEKKTRNGEADALAVQGAASGWADPVVGAMQKDEASRIKDAQMKMNDVAKAR